MFQLFNPFPNKPRVLHVCSTSLLKTLWEKEKLLLTSNFSFSHSIFYPFADLSSIFNSYLKSSFSFNFWKSLKFVVWERVRKIESSSSLSTSSSRLSSLAPLVTSTSTNATTTKMAGRTAYPHQLPNTYQLVNVSCSKSQSPVNPPPRELMVVITKEYHFPVIPQQSIDAILARQAVA